MKKAADGGVKAACYQDGLLTGIEKRNTELVKHLIQQGLSLERIATFLQLSVEEVQRILEKT